MTSSRDSLIPDTKPRSEAEARIEAALTVARECQRISEKRVRREPPDYMGAAFDGYEALCKIVGILDGGKS